MTRKSFISARQACAAAALLAATSLASGQALAWGHTGHVFISRLAIKHLPDTLPEFVRDDGAAHYIAELGAEADVSKSAGDAATPNVDVHDFERDSGHYIDFDDSGYVIPYIGYPEVASLNVNAILAPGQGRRDFDTLLRTNTPSSFPFQETQYTGYLPYNMVDQWQQVRKDFAYIRAFTAAIANPATADSDRAYFTSLLAVRQKLTLRDIGYWSHFVGDASQPLHVSIHYNGWGNYPNPQGYTTAPIHAPFEGAYVKANVKQHSVEDLIGPDVPCNCTGIEARVRGYLAASLAQVVPLYQATGPDLWTDGSNTVEKNFVTARLAAGATELRDEIVDAWTVSDTIYVGYPLVKVADIESGAVVWTANAFAGD